MVNKMILLYIKIFLARICDVGLGTIRTMYIIKGNKLKTCLIAFFELLIWFYAAELALTDEHNSIYIAISYALGYTTGTYLGMLINDHLNKDMLKIDVIFKELKNMDILKLKDYKIYFKENEVTIFIRKKQLNKLLRTIKNIDKEAFIYSSNIRIM